MIFNTLIKGGGGITGKPIEVTELPTLTASDVDKIYLLKEENTTYLSPQVGQPIGDKIYFNTELSPLDYISVAYGGTRILAVGDLSTSNYHQLMLIDLFEVQGITGMGHCYVVAMGTPDMSSILGVPYIYCDVLSVEQFNTNVGAAFGIQITEFGWQYAEIDTSSIADWNVSENNCVLFDNIAYTSTESTFKEEYYKCVEVKDAVEVGKPVPEILCFDTSKTPEFDRSASPTEAVHLLTQDQYFTVASSYNSGEGVEENLDGSLEALILLFSGQIPVILYIDGTASLEVINNLMGQFGEITHKGWQIDGTLDIREKGLEVATSLGLSQEEFEQALALAFADPVVTFNDPQGLFLFPTTYKFEPLGESGFPIEVEEFPTNVTEDDIGKVYLNTTTNEYYAYSYSPLVVGETLGTVITYDTSKIPTFVTNAQHNYLITADDVFLIAGTYFSNEQTNGEGDAYLIMAGLVGVAQKLLYVDGSASIEVINTALQNANLEPVAYKGWQGTGNLDIITWFISIGNTSVSAEQIQEIKDFLDALPIIEINDSEGLFAKGLALSLNNKSTFARELSQKNTEISTLTDEKNALSNEVVAMVQRYVPKPYKWDTTRSYIKSYEFSGWSKYNGALQIPDSITSLRERAFYGSDVERVTLHDGITSIPYYCFENSSTYVDLPSTVTRIMDRAFYGNDRIFTLNIPASVTDIGEAAFANMKELSSITVEDGNEKFHSIDGVLYRDNPTRLCCYPADKTGADFSTTANVDSYAFDGCNILKNLTVEGSIQKNAFKGCTSLVSLHIGDFDYGLTLNDMFGGNIPHTLTSIEVGEYYSIPDRFFAGAWNVKNISLSFNTYTANYFVAGVGNYAFSGCSDLNSLTLTSPSLRYIGIYALSGCSSLTSLELSDEILIIADSAFNGCTALPNVELPNKLLVIGRDAFGYCTSLNSIHIPDSVTFIKDYAFVDCTGLTSATIGCGVTNIGAWLFGNCTNLRSVTCKAVSPPITDGDIFHGCTSLNEIYVPAESVEAYKSATNWSKYADYIKAIPTEGLAYTLNSDNASYTVSGIGTATDKNIGIPDTYEGLPVTKIGNNAFIGKSLTSVVIPDSVTTIGMYGFGNCSSLKSVVIGNSVTYIGDGAFQNGSQLTSIVIPDSVTSISIAAFSNCTRLTSVTIGNSVTSISSLAFQYCSSCLEYDFSNCTRVPTLGNADVFKNINANAKIVVPDSLYDTWIAATNWSDYASYIVKKSEYTEA